MLLGAVKQGKYIFLAVIYAYDVFSHILGNLELLVWNLAQVRSVPTSGVTINCEMDTVAAL